MVVIEYEADDQAKVGINGTVLSYCTAPGTHCFGPNYKCTAVQVPNSLLTSSAPMTLNFWIINQQIPYVGAAYKICLIPFTPTVTPSYTRTWTPTATTTNTFTMTSTSSFTPTWTPTFTSSFTPTFTPTFTNTFTSTFTPTYTPTFTPTPTVTPTPTWTVVSPCAPYAFINFQPNSAGPPPTGYLEDRGQVFGPRGNGFTYGWTYNVTNNYWAVRRLPPGDMRYDTFIRMQNGYARIDWSIRVPNGTYDVRVVMGDKTTTNQQYHILVEGTSVAGGQTPADRFVDRVVHVTVTNGVLNINNPNYSPNTENKLNFIEIYQCSEILTPTPTYTYTATWTKSATATQTPTPSPTITPTYTPSFTKVATNTQTPTPTPTVTSTVTLCPYLQGFRPGGNSSIIVFQAEDFDVNVPQGGHSWNVVTAPPGASGGQAMRAVPNNGTANLAPAPALANSPRLDYEVNFTVSGTYYVWVRGSAAAPGNEPGNAGNNDSVHAGLDAAIPNSAANITWNGAIAWTWTNIRMDGGRATLNVTAGIHTFSLWMREDGARVDKIILTTNPAFDPNGGGPAVNFRNCAGTPTLTQTVTPTPTNSPTFTPSYTKTATPTQTATPTPSNTVTPTSTWTPTITRTWTNTPVPTISTTDCCYHSGGVATVPNLQFGSNRNGVDPTGHLIVSVNTAGQVRRYATDLSSYTTWTVPGTAPEISSIDVDSAGNVYAVKWDGTCRIAEYSPTGALVTEWLNCGPGPGSFTGFADIAVDKSDNQNVFIVDWNTGLVQEFRHTSPTAMALTAFWNVGMMNAHFGITTDAAGLVYITNGTQVLVYRASAGTGTLVSGSPWDAAAVGGADDITADGNGFLYTVSSTNNSVTKWDLAGHRLCTYQNPGTGPGQLNAPDGIVASPDGTLWVSESSDGRVQKLIPCVAAPSPTFTSTPIHCYEPIGSWGTFGNADGQFNEPWNISADNSGHIYVADASNRRIEMFDSNGIFIRSWGQVGTNPGDMILPQGVAAAENGFIYNTTYGGGASRLQCFNPLTAGLIFDYELYGSPSFMPSFMCADGLGNIFVGGVASGAPLIQKYNLGGTYLGLEWGNTGTGDAILSEIMSMSADRTGKVYITDNTNLIKVYDGSGGSLISVITRYSGETGWSQSSDNSGLIEFTGTDGLIAQIDPISHATLLNFGNGIGTGLGQYSTVSYGSVTGPLNGWLYVTDYGNNRVDVYAPCGTPHLSGW